MFGWRRVGGLALVGVLAGVLAGCDLPSDDELGKKATSPAAQSQRAEEDGRIRGLIERLGRVEGLQHVVTVLDDDCYRRPWNAFESRAQVLLNCEMHATVDFGVRGDITAVLPRIQAAGLASWGSLPAQKPWYEPQMSGTVGYALAYHRDRGHYPDGTPMPGPRLEAHGLSIDWDRPDLPPANRIEEPAPCLPPSGGDPFHRCSQAPEGSGKVAEARARYGVVLELRVSGSAYFTVKK